MNLEFALTRKALAQDKNLDVVTDSPVAIRIWNKAGLAVTSVTVTTATNIVLIDSAGTTTLAFATYDTVAKLAAAINATTSWGCKVLDALLTQATASQFVTGAISSSVRPNGVTVWDLKQDTSASLLFIACAAVEREVGTENVAKTRLHRVNLYKFSYTIDVGTAAADKVQIWRRNNKSGIETQELSRLSVDNSATTVFDTSASNHAWLTGAEGEEFILLVTDAATLADNAANIMSVLYQVE